MICPRSTRGAERNEEFCDKEMSNVVDRKAYRTERLQRGVVFVPMPVKALHGIWRFPVRQKQWLSVSKIGQFCVPMWVMQGAYLFQISSEKLLHSRIVCKVNGLDFTSIAAFVHYPGLPSNTLVAVAANGQKNHFV